MHILKVQNLSKEYPEFHLNDINFTIPEGSITGLIGINGSGKTTLIKIISGLVNRNSGTMEFKGESYDPMLQHTSREQIGIVLDGGYFYENVSVNDMKKIYASSYKEWDNDTYKNLITQFGIPANRKIHQLSKGMKMKFSLVLALSHKAQLLIMDEPTSGLDPLIRKQFVDLLSEWVKTTGGSVMFSTHIISDLEKAADNIIMIHNGELIFQEKTDVIKEKNLSLETLMLNCIQGDVGL
ncbi:ABC-2 type transport system ATP-binding protein [Aequitasia blattaphilus]|uniref:ABC transporter ATP-binding protein n=1 Tax=Aequitasia blattaphilus TaxID=2949332 RepID=A0ABT1EB12_9FIRM|nr:ABC transporter ATP-binding protein [Aequitasia blattaphilus]MCP1102137.1 ABC transporter ATP-binding protein [Aequitasia blattaphilus]MCR8614777.1 ABC transporter ATP-binding protein [Aequitasia blattaphilus]